MVLSSMSKFFLKYSTGIEEITNKISPIFSCLKQSSLFSLTTRYYFSKLSHSFFTDKAANTVNNMVLGTLPTGSVVL
jgi:hypothetical protein